MKLHSFSNCKPTRATAAIHQHATLAANSGAIVHCDYAYSIVSIDLPGCERGVFMQGDEADEFIQEIESLVKRYPSLTYEVAYLALAWYYLYLID